MSNILYSIYVVWPHWKPNVFIGVLNSHVGEEPVVTEGEDMMLLYIKIEAHIFSLFYWVCTLVTSLFLFMFTVLFIWILLKVPDNRAAIFVMIQPGEKHTNKKQQREITTIVQHTSDFGKVSSQHIISLWHRYEKHDSHKMDIIAMVMSWIIT